MIPVTPPQSCLVFILRHADFCILTPDFCFFFRTPQSKIRNSLLALCSVELILIAHHISHLVSHIAVVRAPGYGFTIGAGSVEGASTKILLKVKCISAIHILIAQEITIAGQLITARIVKPSPAESCLKVNASDRSLIHITIEISLCTHRHRHSYYPAGGKCLIDPGSTR